MPFSSSRSVVESQIFDMIRLLSHTPLLAVLLLWPVYRPAASTTGPIDGPDERYEEIFCSAWPGQGLTVDDCTQAIQRMPEHLLPLTFRRHYQSGSGIPLPVWYGRGGESSDASYRRYSQISPGQRYSWSVQSVSLSYDWMEPTRRL